MKKQVPGFVTDYKSVDWKLNINAWSCPYLNFDWCNYLNTNCCWNICTLKIKDSFKVKEEK